MSQQTFNQYLARIKDQDPKIKAFLYIKEKDQPTEGSLSDLTIAVKDNIMVKDLPVTVASKILEGHTASYDATVIQKLLSRGIKIIGKTNLDEFAMGSSTENSGYQKTINPWDEKKVPGGSSGGSAAAVAADFCDVALGSDTGGSVRQPAAFCGVTGLKPTYGTVSRYGLIALASSLDVIGPIARDAEILERVFETMSGEDEFDQTTFDYHYQKRDLDLKKLRIGLPKQLWEIDTDPEILTATKEFIAWAEDKGAQISEIDLPALKYGLNAYYVILPSEAMANLARYDGIRYQNSVNAKTLIDRYFDTRSLFGPEVKRRIIIGTFALSVGHYDDYYQTANRARSLIVKDFQKAFKDFDLLVSPTTPTLPFDLGSRTDDPLDMYKADVLTVSVNLAGLPAISMPAGFSQSKLPIGVQAIANHQREDQLLSLAKQFQKETKHHLQKPRNG